MFAALGVNFIKFVIASAIGAIPGVCIGVYVGSVSKSLIDAYMHGGSQDGELFSNSFYVFAGIGAALSITSIVVMSYITRKEFKKFVEENGKKEEEEKLRKKKEEEPETEKSYGSTTSEPISLV